MENLVIQDSGAVDKPLFIKDREEIISIMSQLVSGSYRMLKSKWSHTGI